MFNNKKLYQMRWDNHHHQVSCLNLLIQRVKQNYAKNKANQRSYKACEIEDEKSGLTDNQRTMREFCSMANSLIPFIQVTSDRQDDNKGNTLPVLDLQCWVEGGLVLHKFYKKPMGSQYCLMEASAMGSNTKWATLSQEMIRRMKNTSQRIFGAVQ